MKWFCIVYLYLSGILMFSGLIYNFRHSRHAEIEPPLRMLFFFGGLLNILYASAMLTTSLKTAYLLFGAYYFAVDLVQLSIMAFVRRYTNIRQYNNRLQVVLSIASAIDAVLMLINCFYPVVFQCEQVQDRQGNLFCSIGQKEFLYIYHVIVVYLMTLISLTDLIRRLWKSPKIYKIKYAIIFILDLIIMMMYAVYLQSGFKIDYSIMWIVVVAFSVSYFSLYYIPRGLMDKLMFFTISNMQDGIICLDIEKKCVHANKTARIYCDNEISQQVKIWFSENISSDDESGSWSSLRRIEGEMRHYELEYKKMYDADGKSIGCFFTIHDCTEESNRFEAEKYRATHDSLTGVYNKEYFYEKVRGLIEKNSKVQYCIVCTDVKNFKIVNDVFGVQTGDEVLIQIAGTIRSMAEERWVYGRLTGDRFAVCLPKSEFNEEIFLEETATIAKILENYVFKIQIHVGVYFIEDRELRVSVMCDRANLAIKTIKSSYQNTVAYYKETLRENFINEQKIVSDFDMALHSGQFRAYVQPQVLAETGKIQGGEVLVRWIHPKSGMVPPYQFIPTFEQTGLIGRLDSYMWELACQKLQQWERQGLTKYYLSVNISQKDFYLLDVYEILTSLVEKYQISPENLHLEITETAVMNNPEIQLPLISKLREYGFLIEIDDFGSGYSSLNTLKDLNADVLKIDMGFLKKTVHQERSKIILKMVVSLAKALKMEIITEGVETQEQVDFLKEYGCDIFQGYRFARPMPMTDFEENYLNRTMEV